MSSNPDNDPTGIPTRAIHEAYLDMQRALKRHRQAVDRGDERERDRAHGDVQEAVLTFYELLRPHIKKNDAVSNYWNGKLPPYESGTKPDPEEGKGVIQIQEGYEILPLDREQLQAVGDVDTRREWHELLNLNGNVRIQDVGLNDDGTAAVVNLQKFQLGLRNMDRWKTDIVSTQVELGEFLGNVTRTKKERQRVAFPKLRRASRELSDVAKEMGYLPQDDIPDNDDALPI